MEKHIETACLLIRVYLYKQQNQNYEVNMVLSQKQRNVIIKGIERGLLPRIKQVKGGGQISEKTYPVIYMGRRSAGAASEENLKQVNAILEKRGLKPVSFSTASPLKPLSETPIGLAEKINEPPVGLVAVQPPLQTGLPVGLAAVGVQPDRLLIAESATLGTQPSTIGTTPPVQPVIETPALTTQTPPSSTPPPAAQTPPADSPPPNQDRQFISAAMGLSTSELVRQTPKLSGTIQAVGVLTKIVGDAEWQFKVTAELGRVIMYESMKHLSLDDKERDKPELAVKKIELWIRELVEMKYHADVLEDVMYENEVARKAISELQRYAETSALAYETVTNVLCDRCKRRAMWALAIKSVGGEHLLEKQEVISK